MLTETVLLGIVCGAAGLAVAQLALSGAKAVSDKLGAHAGLNASLNPKVFAFCLLLSLSAGMLIGLAPALGFARLSSFEALKENGVSPRRASNCVKPFKDTSSARFIR